MSETIELGIEFFVNKKFYIGRGVYYYPYSKAISGLNFGASIGYNHISIKKPIYNYYNTEEEPNSNDMKIINRYSLNLSIGYNWIFNLHYFTGSFSIGYSIGARINTMLYYLIDIGKPGFKVDMQIELISVVF